MELKAYINILLRKWWIILPTFLITLTVGIILVYTQTPVYRATTTFVVVPSSSLGDLKSIANGIEMLSRRDEIATTFAEIASSRTIGELAWDSISLETDNYVVTGKLRAGTNIIEFTAEGPDPIVVRDLANAVGVATEEYVKGSFEVFIIRPLDKAITPANPISPNKTMSLTLAAVLGLILGAGLAFFSMYLETPFNSIAEINIIDHELGSVYNKDYFLRRLSNEMVRAKRNRYPLSIALMHIVDDFGLLKGKNSNTARAEILQQVTALTGQYVREEDLTAYMGDNTFVFLLPDMTGENAKAVMEYIQSRIGLAQFRSTAAEIKVTLKSMVGVAAYNHNGTSRDDFVAQADRALQLAEVSENGSTYLVTDFTGRNNHYHG